ncbi:NUDIX hydrolase [Paenisporosarcina sp.]|uniref:NUDIX hydrolase n=1 Tax=Paenisporosarcina sp. TaxID=1932001 RepID=UPI003C763DB7
MKHFIAGLSKRLTVCLTLYFQLRSHLKKDFPGLFDITAAGHLLAHEKVSDGIREVREELGVDLCMEDLKPIGIFKDSIVQRDFIDNEFAHTYVYIMGRASASFRLQEEEVSAIYSVPIADVISLYEREIDHITLACIHSNSTIHSSLIVKPEDFVPHSEEYTGKVLKSLNRIGGMI